MTMRTDDEMEQMATIGVAPDDHEAYEANMKELKAERNLAIQQILAPDLTGEWEGG